MRLLLAAALAAVLSLTAVSGFAASGPEPAAEILNAIVGVKAKMAPDDPTAADLGQEREGSGIVIDDKGLVLTIGYLMRRADSAEITDANGRTIPAQVVATDDDTGFGLLRALEPLKVTPAKLGDASALKEGSQVLVVSQGRPPEMTAARVFARRSFAGSWEYLVDNAIFTVPVHGNFGGAALLGEDGSLVGVGSLYINVAETTSMVPGNMFVPIDLLKPILSSLVAKGSSGKPSRPWLGVRLKDSLGKVVVTGTVDDSPGKRAGLSEGDIVVGVDRQRVTTMVEFFRKVWGIGDAGVTVPLDVFRAAGTKMEIERVALPSVDRNVRYKTGRKQGL
jgi:S1-C subfamily serine protease